jgi:myo-inositol-1(or 4)-monophosphatase
VALDWCWLAAGRCHVYLHGGQRLWDYAAGSLVLAEAGGAGGLVETYDGDWVRADSLAPRIALAAAGDALLASWRAWLQDANRT